MALTSLRRLTAIYSWRLTLCLLSTAIIFFTLDIIEIRHLNTLLYSETVTLHTTTSSSNEKHKQSSVGFIENQEYIANDCTSLTQIKPTDPSSFTQSPKVHKEKSHDNISPTFYFGSQFRKGAATVHMSGDTPYFKLIHEYISTNYPNCNNDCVTFDMGANQGFYTYYLATLGMEVHSFEINDHNFISLKHGLLFNPSEVSKRVHIYQIGMSDEMGWSGQRGNGYGGFLDKSTKTKKNNDDKKGSILSITFDCFVQHTKPNLLNVPFVKIDVEGYEIAAIKGAKMLFHSSVKIGVWFMEVGPSRWDRAGISLDTGIIEMEKLASHFKTSFIIFRGFDKHCPDTIAEEIHLSDANPKILEEKLHMHKVKYNEIQLLLKHMYEKDSDCNFWFEN